MLEVHPEPGVERMKSEMTALLSGLRFNDTMAQQVTLGPNWINEGNETNQKNQTGHKKPDTFPHLLNWCLMVDPEIFFLF